MTTRETISSKPGDAPADAEGLHLVFDERNRLLLRRAVPEGPWTFGDGSENAPGRAVPVFSFPGSDGKEHAVHFLVAASEEPLAGPGEARFVCLAALREEIAATPAAFDSVLRTVVERLRPYLIRIPYLYKGENDYIYRFRTERQRNRDVYRSDPRSEGLYQSDLCEAIKAVKRANERAADAPAELDFGPVSYVLPSHFGFCLGVQNAIERAYESIAENPGRRVFMLSELIHNPFVNEDLLARGLRYLQTDRGLPVIEEESGRAYWDFLTEEDVVVIPAFGATDEDKIRLIEKGISINRYDATCMLVEKVWKAARRFSQAGYTVIIHGKAEHEETKATFSNAAKFGPAFILRNREEAEIVVQALQAEAPTDKRRLMEHFTARATPGFDPAVHLERLAVVNQTTLLRNETLEIIALLEEALAQRFGVEEASRRLNSNSKGDTLCYATQVNQDALEKALARPLDLAIVAGGKNSSNTFQLFRMCQSRLGERAFYIQSERNILTRDLICHYDFNARGSATDGLSERPFLPGDPPLRILITGGASCPDGIIQQIINRINSFFPPAQLRPVGEVLAGFRQWEKKG